MSLNPSQAQARKRRRKRQSLPASAFCGPNRTFPAIDAAHTRAGLASLHLWYKDVMNNQHQFPSVVKLNQTIDKIKKIHENLMRRARKFGVQHTCEFEKELEKQRVPTIPITFIYEGELIYKGLIPEPQRGWKPLMGESIISPISISHHAHLHAYSQYTIKFDKDAISQKKMKEIEKELDELLKKHVFVL